MSIKREDVQNFSELDAETRIRLLLEYIKSLQGMIIENPRNSMDNVSVNVAIKKAYEQLEKEFEK